MALSSTLTALRMLTISVTNGSHHIPTTKLAFFAVRRDEWDTKEGTGKSMMNALYA